MGFAMTETLDTLDVMGVEVRLDFALDELRDDLGADPDAGPLVQWICDAVDRVEMRQVRGPEDVMTNITELKKVREALRRLGIRGEEANKHLDDYIRVWLQQG